VSLLLIYLYGNNVRTSELRSPLEFTLTTGVSGASECQKHCDTMVAGVSFWVLPALRHAGTFELRSLASVRARSLNQIARNNRR
jgi:hypothetical protein